MKEDDSRPLNCSILSYPISYSLPSILLLIIRHVKKTVVLVVYVGQPIIIMHFATKPFNNPKEGLFKYRTHLMYIVNTFF